MKKPSVIHWAITSQCNLNCGFCFAYQGKKDLNTRKSFEVIDRLVPLNIKKLVITGGEPLVRKDIIKIVNYAKKKGFNIRIDTNAILLPKYIARLKVDAIGISLDGPDAATDQEMRNHKSHFKKVILSLKKTKNVKVIIHTLATKLNYKKIPEMANLLEKYKVSRWSIFEFCPYARGFQNRKKYQITPRQFETMKRKIKYKGVIDFCRIKNRTRAYFFITSDGSIYTQLIPNQKNSPKIIRFGGIFLKIIRKNFLKISALRRTKKEAKSIEIALTKKYLLTGIF